MQSYKATVGADFMEKEVTVDGKIINLEVSFKSKADLGHCWTGEIQESWWCLLQRSRLLCLSVRYYQQKIL